MFQLKIGNHLASLLVVFTKETWLGRSSTWHQKFWERIYTQKNQMSIVLEYLSSKELDNSCLFLSYWITLARLSQTIIKLYTHFLFLWNFDVIDKWTLRAFLFSPNTVVLAVIMIWSGVLWYYMAREKLEKHTDPIFFQQYSLFFCINVTFFQD